jgi:anti-sigma factor RsiW
MNPDKLFDYLDGKLSPAEREQVEQRLATDSQLQRQLAVAREIHRGMSGSREVIVPSSDQAAAERGGRLGRRVATAAAILVFANVAIGLIVIAGKNKNRSSDYVREAQIREQLTASLGAAAQNALPAPTFAEEELKITAPRADWDQIAEKILAGATAFGGSAAKGLPDQSVMTVLVDIPSSRNAEFRQVLTSASRVSPMPAIAPGVKGEPPRSEGKNERTIVQVRISEPAR